MCIMLDNMIRTLKWMVFFLCIFLSACITEDEEMESGNNLKVGDRIPSFSVVMNDGSRVEDEDLLGEVSLIVFFNTACKDCQQELPVIQRFYEAFPQYPLLCISREEGEASVSAYWQKQEFTMPYSAQQDRKIYQLFASHTIPRIYVVDEEGIIRAVFTDNPLASYEDLVQAVEGQLAPSE